MNSTQSNSLYIRFNFKFLLAFQPFLHFLENFLFEDSNAMKKAGVKAEITRHKNANSLVDICAK